ncbi:MAG: carboxypeptidase-like regulatory domain-containing protein [Ekhidna sp.]
MRRQKWIFTFFLLYASFAQSQNISGQFNNTNFKDFASQIEQQTGWRVFYDPELLDTLTVTASFTNQRVTTALEVVFRGTKLKANYFENAIFVFNDLIIQTELPDDFLSRDASDSAVTDEILVDIDNSSGSDDNRPPLIIGTRTSRILPGNATVSGRVVDKSSGEPILGASVYIEEPLIGTFSDLDGRFSLSLPRGRQKLLLSSVGMEPEERMIIVYSDGSIEIQLEEITTALDEVVVEAERDDNLLEPQMGVEKLNIKTVKLVPTALGEADIVRVLMTLPGVKSVGEASNGFNVRGGSSDQNLILFNNSTIYNQSHLFGFFSAFNPDVIQNVELYKSSIPAEFGGRLSSILQVNSRVGDSTKISGSGGIGLVTGRITVDGPIGDKTTFLIGGRATYSNWILKTIKNEDYRNSSGSFYDMNVDINHRVDDKNTLKFYAYRSNDSFKLRSDTLYSYSNNAANVLWRRDFEDFYTDVSVGFSNYTYDISSASNPVNAFELGYGISQVDAKADLNYFGFDGHSLNFGLNTIQYYLESGSLLPQGEESLITPSVLQDERASETSLYLSDSYEVSTKLNVSVGVRGTLFRSKGPRDYFVYAEGVPKSDQTIIDTVSAAGGQLIKAYPRPEFRVSARYTLTDESSVKIGFNSMNQFIHRMSNTVAVSPTDVWKLSDFNIKPQSGNQVSIGYFRNFKSGLIETSVETYYKRIRNVLDYKSGAVLTMNPNLEADLLNTRGRAYGVELLIKKTSGRLNGWLGYSYSRSELRQDDALAGELINDGNWYPSNFDKPHDFTAVMNYKLSKRYSISLNMTYSTGRPVTVPLEQFTYARSRRLLYSDRNEFRVPDYFRTDIAFNIDGNHKLNKPLHGSWTIAIYNLTGRRNANSIYFLSEGGGIQGYQLSIFGNPIPTITYNFKF